MIKLYNTLTKQKEILKTIEENKVRMYVCGPTVYNYIHIGNARPIIVFDVVRKYLEHSGYEVDFISSQEFPELIHQENWDLIKKSSPYLKTWLIYNKGKTVAYVWNSKKLSDSEARKKAELQLLLM